MVFVVGAVAIDLIAMRAKFLDGTSNPSDIRVGLGGVGYRIFSNLEVPRKFITALAGDPISRWARDALEADGGVAIQRVKDQEVSRARLTNLVHGKGNGQRLLDDAEVRCRDLEAPAFHKR